MKVVNLTFGKAEKTPKIIEEKVNGVLEQGKFSSATQTESPTTGRLYLSIFLKDEPADTTAKVFREISQAEMTAKMNSYLEDAKVQAITQSVSSKSNALITTVFCKKKA